MVSTSWRLLAGTAVLVFLLLFSATVLNFHSLLDDRHTPRSLTAASAAASPSASASLRRARTLQHPSTLSSPPILHRPPSFRNTIPIIILTCCGSVSLRATLQSLLTVRGSHPSQITVIEDSASSSDDAHSSDTTTRSASAAAAVAASFGARHVVHSAAPSKSWYGHSDDGSPDAKASRIARHYRFALGHAFGAATASMAPGLVSSSVVVLEDDLLFSPDLLEFFAAGAAVLRRDPSLWAVSAWNDNGFKGLVRDTHALRRTQFFPGLGWLLTRSLWENELRDRWPATHWDHWMRSQRKHRTSKGREVLFPEVPRAYHAATQGSFMTRTLHERYFKRIAMNTDPEVAWAWGRGGSRVGDEVDGRNDTNRRNRGGGTVAVGIARMAGTAVAYERRIEGLCRGAFVVRTKEALSMLVRGASWEELTQGHYTKRGSRDTSETGETGESGEKGDRVVVVVHRTSPAESGEVGDDSFAAIADCFGLWRQERRGMHNGMHEFWWDEEQASRVASKVLLVVGSSGSGGHGGSGDPPRAAPIKVLLINTRFRDTPAMKPSPYVGMCGGGGSAGAAAEGVAAFRPSDFARAARAAGRRTVDVN